MTSRFFELAFTPDVLKAQAANGAAAYARHVREGNEPDSLGPNEAAFIASRDSFYMATTSETGWPYIQHRGGPTGFVKILDERQLAIADYRGNRQYISLGNIASDDRVALFFMDYPNQARLKMLAHVRAVEASSDPATVERVRDAAYSARIERALVFTVEAFDWNCPQHITPRYTYSQVQTAFAMMEARQAALEATLREKGVSEEDIAALIAEADAAAQPTA